MDESRLADFLKNQERTYAESLWKSGSFSTIADAEFRSRTKIEAILASKTENQFFFRIVLKNLDGSQPEELGILWWAQRKNDGGVWIYDVEIHEKFRRRGYAHSALLELEKWGRIHACPHIGLNVFTYNYGAENFTESLVS